MSPTIRLGLILLGLVAITVLVYLPGVGGGFVFDDHPNIVDNIALHVTSFSTQEWGSALMSSPAANLPRPLAMLSFAVNHYFTGLDPLPMKLTNIAIHAVNALLAFGLTKCIIRAKASDNVTRYLSPNAVAFLVVAFWALHPINAMPVLLIVQRMETLSHTFVLLGLWLYTSGRIKLPSGGAGAWPAIFVGTVGCTIVGIMAKESAALLPLYAASLEAVLFKWRDETGRIDRRLLVLFLCVLVIPAVVGGTWLIREGMNPAAYIGRPFTLFERLLTEPRVVVDYLHWIVAPNLGTLSLYHDDYIVSSGLLNPPSTLISILLLAALFALSWLLRHVRPLASLGIAWFLFAHLLTATFLPLELVFEHRNYFAAFGIALVIGDFLLVAPQRLILEKFGLVVVTALAIMLAGMTSLRAFEWRNAVVFAATEAAKNPNSPRATYYFGWVLATATGYDPNSPLIEPALKRLDQARTLPDSNILPDQAALILAARTGIRMKDQWWEHMELTLRTKPIGPQETGALAGMVTCAVNRYCVFPPDRMLGVFTAALEQGAHPEVLNVYASYSLNILGDAQLARTLWEDAVALNPREAQYHIALIKLDIAEHRILEATRRIEGLQRLGRFGQHRRIVAMLHDRLRQAENEPHPKLKTPDGSGP